MAAKKGGSRGGGRKPRSGGDLQFSFKPLSNQVEAHITFLSKCKQTDEVTKALAALNIVADALQSGKVCPQQQICPIKPGV
jgi:hypothetical protein